MDIKEHSKYWERIKINIKKLYKEGKITEKYTFESFCNDFIPAKTPLPPIIDLLT